VPYTDAQLSIRRLLNGIPFQLEPIVSFLLRTWYLHPVILRAALAILLPYGAVSQNDLLCRRELLTVVSGKYGVQMMASNGQCYPWLAVGVFTSYWQGRGG
jgi:hypothetical protein